MRNSPALASYITDTSRPKIDIYLGKSGNPYTSALPGELFRIESHFSPLFESGAMWVIPLRSYYDRYLERTHGQIILPIKSEKTILAAHLLLGADEISFIAP